MLFRNGLPNECPRITCGRKARQSARASHRILFCETDNGYVYGFVNVVLISFDMLRRGMFKTKIVKELAPAAATGAALILFLGAVFGPHAVASTILPLR